ncbi:MAG TPA: XRE family transcriptional regulator [Pseudolabrys sp.]|jgi:HTH-type transcriptional regulator/antitoxin HigA|nr:XRE family transcriptional regulator [Pseudolabrys sp.]
MMDVRAIHNDTDYEWALQEIGRYFENEPEIGSEDGDRFEVLSELIKSYEDKTFVIPQADPIEILKFAIESMGKSQADLSRIIGRNRASEILSRRRALTLEMIRLISQAWNLPIETLTPAYELAREYA